MIELENEFSKEEIEHFKTYTELLRRESAIRDELKVLDENYPVIERIFRFIIAETKKGKDL